MSAENRLIPCAFEISRETGEILTVERREVEDEAFLKLASAVFGVKLYKKCGGDRRGAAGGGQPGR